MIILILSEVFGLRSAKLLVMLVMVFVLISSVSAHTAFKSYGLVIEFEKNNHNLIEVDIGLVWNSSSLKMAETYYELVPGIEPEDVFYSYELKHEETSSNNLKEGFFYVPKGVYSTVPPECFYEDAESLGDDCVSYFEPEHFLFYLNIPYVPRAKIINLFDEEKNKILSVDVSRFADYCGDGICSGRESYYTCPKDCKEEPFMFREKFLASNFDVRSSNEFRVYYSANSCNEFSDTNCLEELSQSSNFFSNQNSEIVFNNANNRFNFFFEENSNIILTNDESKIELSEEYFKISFDGLNSFAKVSKKFEYEGISCVEIFNPRSNLNPLERNC